ncbi:MAG: amidohydrolase family protein [Gammaproteobacteria bacterium]
MTLRWLLAGVVCLAGCASIGSPRYFDVLIRNGIIYDGTGAAARAGDIGIVDGRIVTLNAAAADDARRVIDATDRIVTPGFIDPHTHATGDLKHPQRNANAGYLLQGVTTVFIGNDGYGVNDRVTTLALFQKQGIGTNVAFFAGHGGIRKRVMALADRAPTSSEMDAMVSAVDAAMEQGALGLSSGLYYAPGSYSDTSEVIALAAAAARAGGVYDTHLRVESVQAPGLLNAVAEAITIGREANIPVHISHIKALGADSWGASAAVIEQVEAARATGQRVTANQYPWRASGTRFSNVLIPRWVMADSKAAMRTRLSDDSIKAQIRDEMIVNLRQRGGPDAMLVSDPDSPWQGKTLAEVATATDNDVLETAIRLILQGDPSIASFVMDPTDIRAFASRDWVMTGSDGSRGHPRKVATYPKAYQDFVVHDKVMSLARFVQRSTGQVASEFGLCDRGRLLPGMRADIAVIDPPTFIPRATYADATKLSTGVDYLLIDGHLAVDRGQVQTALHGQVVRRSQQRCVDE